MAFRGSAREAYMRTCRDLATSLGCPQCRASELMNAVKDEHDAYSRGQRMACAEVLSQPHECGTRPPDAPPTIDLPRGE